MEAHPQRRLCVALTLHIEGVSLCLMRVQHYFLKLLYVLTLINVNVVSGFYVSVLEYGPSL